MKRWIILLVFFLFSAINNKAIPQEDNKTYNIQSFDGTNNELHVITDLGDDILRVSCLKDTLRIHDLISIIGNIHILNRNFLEIFYEVRSGSDEDVQYMLLLCVNKKKLYEAMDITSLSTGEFRATYNKKADALTLYDESSLYKINASLTGNSKKNYQLKVNINDSVRSKHDPTTSYSYHNNSVLNFDPFRNVFYSVKKDVYETFKVYDFKTESEYKQQVRGNFPEIILGDMDYYYIKGEWYEVGNNNHLMKRTSTSSK
jgi:hypothetical protein